MNIFNKSVVDCNASNKEFDNLLMLNVALYKDMCNKRDNIDTLIKLNNCTDSFDEELDAIQEIARS